MSLNAPIGIFDSGIGGLSIWKEINHLLPYESTIYLADSKNAPYGEKSPKEIIEFSVKNTELLIELGCKLIVVACNTATTNAINHLRENYLMSFIGIEPATKPAAISTKTGKIGILATKGTLASELFLITSKQFRGKVEIIETIGTGLVQVIEAGELQKAVPLLKKYILPMVEAGVDNIVLGCTHYPFLKPLIKEIIPASINVIDSGNAVAKQTKYVLESKNLLSTQDDFAYQFYTNKNIMVLNSFLDRLGVANVESSFREF